MQTLSSKSAPSFQRMTFQAMNTRIEASLWCTEERLEQLGRLLIDWFQYVEGRFSRFRKDSELTHLNRHAGSPMLISETMLEVLQLANAYRERTKGIFQPMILEALECEGYRGSFQLLQEEEWSERNRVERSRENQTIPVMKLDARMRSVQWPSDGRIDLGGIVKSWSVRRIAAYLLKQESIPAGMINAGGDLQIWNELHHEDSREEDKLAACGAWSIGIQDPWNPERDVHELKLMHGAIATSSTRGRRWKIADGWRHHLIDPRRMSSSRSDIVQCTVVGDDCIECEIWAKVICIIGLEAAEKLWKEELAGRKLRVFLCTDDGRMQWLCEEGEGQHD